jgi:UMF1 family MFS transporter
MVEGNSDHNGDEQNKEKEGCCGWWNFGGVAPAQGYCRLGIARGAIVMSNIFLATSLIYLAAEEAGCLTESDSYDDDCENKVHGFKPSSLIANISIIAGLLSAFCMPVVGAIIDFTPRRKFVGVAAAVIITTIQAIQIYTVSSTWYAMAMLQALAAFMYQAEIISTYAYLPDISRTVGEKAMTGYTAKFTQVQFSAQMLFLVVVIGVSIALDLNDVQTAHVGQGVVVAWIFVWFSLGWMCMPHMPARKELPEGHWLIIEGFVQNWKTAKSINTHYSHGLRWFLLNVVFAEAAAAALTTLSVVYLDETVGMSGTEIGIFFLITLLFTLPGSSLGAYVTHKTNPNTSLRIAQFIVMITAIVGALILDSVKSKPLAYGWGVCFGIGLG